MVPRFCVEDDGKVNFRRYLNMQNEKASVRDHVFSYQCTRSYVSLLVHVISIIMGSFYAG